MHFELRSLIHEFRKSQDEAVELIRKRLGIPMPESDREWVRYCIESGLYQISEMNGGCIKAHGYGIAISTAGLKIDFDWGPNGECDVFDAWRLYIFALENSTDIRCSHDDLIRWLEDAHRIGELDQVGSMYFDPTLRAT